MQRINQDEDPLRWSDSYGSGDGLGNLNRCLVETWYEGINTRRLYYRCEREEDSMGFGELSQSVSRTCKTKEGMNIEEMGVDTVSRENLHLLFLCTPLLEVLLAPLGSRGQV